MPATTMNSAVDTLIAQLEAIHLQEAQLQAQKSQLLEKIKEALFRVTETPQSHPSATTASVSSRTTDYGRGA